MNILTKILRRLILIINRSVGAVDCKLTEAIDGKRDRTPEPELEGRTSQQNDQDTEKGYEFVLYAETLDRAGLVERPYKFLWKGDTVYLKPSHHESWKIGYANSVEAAREVAEAYLKTV